jgi:4-hydroxybenzoate polyprenyltransferase
MNWLQLVRWKNLILIVMTQFLIWFCVIVPLGIQPTIQLFLTPFHFLLLCISTVLIAAAGYIINDYFDYKIDAINRPQKQILHVTMHRKRAIVLHATLNILGILIAIYLAKTSTIFNWVFIQIISTILLFVYSSHFKRWYIIGNVIVAVLTALSVFTLYIYEPALYPYTTMPSMIKMQNHLLANPVWVLGIYTWFAFILTWIREVVKDMEDHIGDASEGCVTMPIKIGLKKTTLFVQILCVFAILPLIIASWKLKGLLGAYVGLAICIPLIIWTIYFKQSTSIDHYFKMSKLLKWIMVLGIGSLIIYYNQAYEIFNLSISIAA